MRVQPLCVAFVAVMATLVACGSDDDDDDGSCVPDDADGVANVDITVALTVDDAAFAPAIITTQNSSNVTLTLTNNGTRPHGFTVDCFPTPNQRGCPAEVCFPTAATIPPIAPGASTTVKFATPAYEAIYTYRSTAEGDRALTTGQFILK